jgi:hypothetical protein
MYALMSRNGTGRRPSTSGSDRSAPVASIHAVEAGTRASPRHLCGFDGSGTDDPGLRKRPRSHVWHGQFCALSR